MKNEVTSHSALRPNERMDAEPGPSSFLEAPLPVSASAAPKSTPDSQERADGRFNLLLLYRNRHEARPWLRTARALAVALVLATACGVVWYSYFAKITLVNGSFVVSGPERPLEYGLRFLALCWALWVIGPPVWFAIEFFYLFDHSLPERDVSRFKYGQELTTKAWATVVVVLGTFLYKSFK